MTNEIVFMVGAVGFVIVLIIFLSIRERLLLKERVAREWQKVPPVTNFDKEESLKEAWQIYHQLNPSQSSVDDITWHDLDMIRVFELVNGTKSSVGAERLYQKMRSFNLEGKEGEEFESLMAYFSEHPQERADMQYQLARAGKRDKNFVWHYLNNPRENQLGNPLIYYILGGLPLVSLLLFFITKIGPFVLVAIVGILINVVFYLQKKEVLQRELMSMNYLVCLIAQSANIAKVPQPFQESLQGLAKKLKLIATMGFAFRVKANSEAEIFFEYLNIAFMLPFISYNLVLKKLDSHQQEAIELLEIIGNIDAAIAVLNFKSIMPYVSQPTFSSTAQVMAVDMYHPLLREPVVNPVNWHRSTLVTGSNASGKSTYIKGVALNAILSQTIGLACAKSWEMKPGHVLSSMALEDDLFQGDSYFVAEIKSVKRIIQQVKKGQTCYCFVDEILRGTNTIERISASSSIVEWLAKSNSLGFVATHDIELTEMLSESCDNIHFEEKVTEAEGIEFDYVLYPGPAKTRNALKLLKVMDFPQDIVTEAEGKAHHFEVSRSW